MNTFVNIWTALFLLLALGGVWPFVSIWIADCLIWLETRLMDAFFAADEAPGPDLLDEDA